ncbi:3-oxoacyl-[acyl-carrier-protein] synthase III C-terminal domain-containing protein [Actinocorallia longicatena]|uniref:3-oxoacyl-[acyl-carrier-protein] synthase III C-terminal domain-containing protein n=1 Tax=Actinocorallia longicatena TaxID=111803 RepID=A0ABP6QA77_9ACTN
MVRTFPYGVTGVAAIVAEPTPIDDWARRARIPYRNHPGRVLTGAEITRIMGVEGKSWDPLLFATLGPAVDAAGQALRSAGLTADDIDTFITATSIPYEPVMDADAMRIASELGLRPEVVPIGLASGCAGLARAAALLAGSDARRALVVTYNAPSRAMGDGAGGVADRYLHNMIHPTGSQLWASPALFSDGAAAMVFERDAGSGGMITYSRDPGDPLVLHPGGSSAQPLSTLEGRMGAAYGMSSAAIKQYYRSGMIRNHQALLSADPRYVERSARVYLHQANPLLVDDFVAAVGLPPEKAPSNVRTYGNLITVSTPLLLHEDLMAGTVRRGDLIAVSLVGAGPERGAYYAPVLVPNVEELRSPRPALVAR